MQTQTPTENGSHAPGRLPELSAPQAARDEDRLHKLAIEQVHRLRRFKLHLISFAIGVPLLSVLWVLTEFFEENTWPSRFASDPDVAGTWDPWLFFAVGIWGVILVIHAMRAYWGPPVGPLGRWIRRPIPEEELEREVAQLKRHGW